MSVSDFRVTTKIAAEIAGVGYEGFRAWLKRGLLRKSGTLPGFQSKESPAVERDTQRRTWSHFGFEDVASFRLAKLAFDAGLCFEIVAQALEQDALRQVHSRAALAETLPEEALADADPVFLAIGVSTFPSWFGLYTASELIKALSFESTAVPVPAFVIDVRSVHEEVLRYIRGMD